MALIYIHNKQCSRENMFSNKNWHNQVHIKKTCWTFMEVQWDTVYSRIRFRNVLSYKRKPADIKQSFTVTSGTVDDSFLNLLFSMPSGYVENFKSNFSLGPYFLLFTFFTFSKHARCITSFLMLYFIIICLLLLYLDLLQSVVPLFQRP